MPCIKINITGDIRNNGFRFGAGFEAGRLNLSGYVDYTGPESLTIEAEGNREKLSEFVQWCRTCPISDRFTSFEVTSLEEKGYRSFEIRHNFQVTADQSYSMTGRLASQLLSLIGIRQSKNKDPGRADMIRVE